MFYLFLATNITNLKIILFLNLVKKKIWANLEKIKELFTVTQKNCQKTFKNTGLGSGIRDLRSGIPKKPIPDPGSQIRGQKDTASPDPDPAALINSLNLKT
jgi:hypothetical protein